MTRSAMPRLVRRAPLIERVKSFFDPYDWSLWISESLSDDVFDDWLKSWSLAVGIGANVVFILARGASHSGPARGSDDVFGQDVRRGSGWFTWLSATLVHLLTLLCCVNAIYTFTRKRTYRLFEHPIDVPPPTPSARRVPVDQSPVAVSPLRYVRDAIATTKSLLTSQSATSDIPQVWELKIWDPKPGSLSLFTLFSPGHLLLYFSLLPPSASDPRPSVAIAKALAFGALLSIQLALLKTSFTRQAKDTSFIHGQVMNEYDTKFVRPILHRPVRDVAVQTMPQSHIAHGLARGEVNTYSPTTIINRGFHVNPNPLYAEDIDALSAREASNTSTSTLHPSSRIPRLPTSVSTPTLNAGYGNVKRRSTPPYSAQSTGTSTTELSSPLKPRHQYLYQQHPAEVGSRLSMPGEGALLARGRDKDLRQRRETGHY